MLTTALIAAALQALPGQLPRTTLSFAAPEELLAGGTPARTESGSLPRAVDLNGDGRQDLVIASAGGSVQVALGVEDGLGESRRLPVPQEDGVRGVAWSAGLGPLPEGLWLAMSEGSLLLQASDQEQGSVTLGRNLGVEHGRFDVGDLNGDGVLDLVVGSFGGPVSLLFGDAKDGSFDRARGELLAGVGEAYNSCPRLRDLDGDGDLDILLGVNWGYLTVHFNEGTALEPRFGGKVLLRDAVGGGTLALRELLEDNSSPDLMDVDGDGLLDLVTGGKEGGVWWLRGVGSHDHMNLLERRLAQGGAEFGALLVRDEGLRGAVFGALKALHLDLRHGLVPERERAGISQRMGDLVERFPAVLRRRAFDARTETFSSPLFTQFALVLKACEPDTLEGRGRVAAILREPEGHARLLVQHGIVFQDNGRATDGHLERMHALLTEIPPATWDVETISVADWIGPGQRDIGVEARSGINIFGLPLGRKENSFPADAPRKGETDVFLICLAHELAHNMLDTVGRRTRPDLYARKFAGLKRAAAGAVVWNEEISRGYDRKATRAAFKGLGAWDGEEDHWREAWVERFHGDDSFERSHMRGNVEFFLNSPQEAFATLANQWFADSELMVELAKARFDGGQKACADQMLLIAEYLSEGGPTVPSYVMRPGGELSVGSLEIDRDPRGRIRILRSGRIRAGFRYKDGDLVGAFSLQVEDR